MRHTAAEKYEVIRLVEGSDLPARRTLQQLQVNRATFYRWYRRYLQHGRAGLEPRPAAARRYWNRIPPRVRQRVVDAALADPERSPRELAWQLTDREGHFLSESSVYRILKAYDRLPSPAFIVLTAAQSFRHPTRRPTELWQTDFTYLQVVGWGWYYLSTVLDDYSRYILAWKLSHDDAGVADVTETLDVARAATDRHGSGTDQTSDHGCSATTAPATSRVSWREYLEPQHGMDAHAGRSIPPDDAGEDRALPPLDEERGEARALPQPVGAGAGHRSLRRPLQPSAAPRSLGQRDAG